MQREWLQKILTVGSDSQCGLRKALKSAIRNRTLFIGPMIDNLVNYRWIGQRGGVAQVVQLVGGHFTQNAAHDFA